MMFRAVVVLCVVGVSLLTSACGQSRVVSRGGTIDVAVTEYRLEPQSVRTSAGQLTIVVHNYGRLTHNFVLTRGGQAAGRTQPIWPGRVARLTLSLTPGSYRMASTILADQRLGTYGTLDVR